MNIDLSVLAQMIMGASILGLFAWVFQMQGRISQFVTWENMREIQDSISSNFAELHSELKKLSEDLAYLRGKSGG